jgi:hypothetical protein
VEETRQAIKHWRARAEEVRARAANSGDKYEQRRLFRIAEFYGLIADDARLQMRSRWSVPITVSAAMNAMSWALRHSPHARGWRQPPSDRRKASGGDRATRGTKMKLVDIFLRHGNRRFHLLVEVDSIF